jgi:hypothetical protein
MRICPGFKVMQFFFRKGIAIIAVIAAGGLVAASSLQDFPASGEPSASDGAEEARYETTGSVGAVGTNRGALALTDEQLERIYQAVMRFPDAVRRTARIPELADRLPSEEAVQDLPATVTAEIPRLHDHKFVKLHDRVLVIEPATRVVVAMIPRYKLLQ